jgi:phosphoserine phosphatase
VHFVALVEKNRSFDLVAFDMDGVLVDYASCWTWVHHHFGVDNEPALLSFVKGEIDDREFMRRDIALWREKDPKLDIDGLKCILEPLPFNEGIEETVTGLRERGIKAVIVSGGLDIVAEKIAQRYGFDDFIANGVESGQLTGEGVLRVELLNKKLALEAFLAKYSVRSERAACVGDSFIDIPMFKACGMSIAFNPMDDRVCESATYVVQNRSLSAVLPFILNGGIDRESLNP